MPLGSFLLTGRFRDFNGQPSTGTVSITGQIIYDTDGDTIRVGPWKRKITRLGEFVAELPTDSTSGDSTAIRYTVQAVIDGRTLAPLTLWAKEAGTSVDYSTPGDTGTPSGSTGGSTIPQTIPFVIGSTATPGGGTPPASSTIPQTIPFTIGA